MPTHSSWCSPPHMAPGRDGWLRRACLFRGFVDDQAQARAEVAWWKCTFVRRERFAGRFAAGFPHKGLDGKRRPTCLNRLVLRIARLGKKREPVKSLHARIADLWCKSMHTAPMWPSHGQYECRTCGQRHRVCWEQPLPVYPRVVASPYETPWSAPALSNHPLMAEPAPNASS
jgi:hypothetical protein